MNKPLYGLLLGAMLGAVDGLTAWFTPEVRPQIIGIVIGSTFKGVIAGVCIGWFAKKVKSLPLGILFGLAVGMFLAYLIAAMPQPSGRHYYFEIMLPGHWSALSWATPLRSILRPSCLPADFVLQSLG
jgi:hypothetical protein